MSKRLDSSKIVNSVVEVNKIIPHPDNPNTHPDAQIAQLAASHEEFGQYRSVVLWKRSNGQYIQVAGHGYLEGARREGVTSIRADILPEDADPVTIKAILVADNLHAHNSSTDDELLATLLQEQSDAGFDLAGLGTDDETLRQMLEALGDEYAADGHQGDEEDEFEQEVDEEQTRVQVGDVWALGRHRIACLDSLDPATYEKLFSDVNPQMIWADPPYGISIVATNVYVGGGEAYDIPFGGVKNRTRGDVGGGASHIRKTGKPYIADRLERLGTVGGAKPFGSKNKGSIGGTNPQGSKNNLRSAPKIEVGKYAPVIGDDTTATAIAAYRPCADFFPSAIHFWWGANYYANALPPSKCWIVWDKENTGNFADAELAWCSHDSAVRIFKHMWNGLMKDSEKGQRRVHPTQKPIALASWCYEKYGKEEDIIYDPFLGSGMSLIAAENTNRTVIGCELSPDYINVILTRWETLTGLQATLLERIEEAAHA